MTLSRPLTAIALIIGCFLFIQCAGHSEIDTKAPEAQAVQTGEVVQPKTDGESSTEKKSSGEDQSTSTNAEPPKVTTPPVVINNPPAPVPGPPTQTNSENGCANLPADTRVGTWDSPDAHAAIGSQAIIAHGDQITSVGDLPYATVLETRARSGQLISQYCLPARLMDYYAGISKFPRGGFVLAGMRTSVSTMNPGAAVHTMVVALVDEKANVIWKYDAAPQGLSEQDFGYSVITDREGNSYVAANVDGFSVVKFSPAGQRLWTYNYASNTGVARAIQFDYAGNIIAGGYIDVNPQSTPGDRDVFVIKLSPAKKIIWKHRVVSPTLDYTYDIAVNAAGKVWLYGWSVDIGAKFGKKSLHLPTTFLISLESDGKRSAIIDLGSSGGYTGKIAILASQKILLTAGVMAGAYTFSGNDLTFSLFSPDGLTQVGKKAYPNSFFNVLNSVAVNSFGEVYAGSTSATPAGQYPRWTFGSIRKVTEAEINPSLHTQ